MAILLVIVVITTSALVLLCLTKKHFYIQRTGLNPFKNIYKVLKYYWNHMVPECHSVFTYWEEDIPPHIDVCLSVQGYTMLIDISIYSP